MELTRSEIEQLIEKVAQAAANATSLEMSSATETSSMSRDELDFVFTAVKESLNMDLNSVHLQTF